MIATRIIFATRKKFFQQMNGIFFRPTRVVRFKLYVRSMEVFPKNLISGPLEITDNFFPHLLMTHCGQDGIMG